MSGCGGFLTEFWCENRSVDLEVIVLSPVWIPRADNQTSGTQHWHVCLPRETWRRRRQRLDCFVFVCLFKCTNSRSNTSCFNLLPVNSSGCCRPVMLCKCFAFIWSYEAHVAQRRGFIPSEMLLNVCLLQPDGRKLLPSGRPKERAYFYTTARFRSSFICWLTATNRDVSQELVVIVNSLRQIHVVFSNFYIFFGLQVVIP